MSWFASACLVMYPLLAGLLAWAVWMIVDFWLHPEPFCETRR
jgi:hypothetical protein